MITASFCFLDVAEGLEYMHAHKYVHGDIKPQNILLRDESSAVIGDVGLSVRMDLLRDGSSAGRRGTPNCMAPQIGSTGVTMSSDVFAFGRSLAFMSTKDFKHPVPPFECMRRSMECHALANVEKLSRHYNVPVDHRAVKSLVNLFT